MKGQLGTVARVAPTAASTEGVTAALAEEKSRGGSLKDTTP